jgi:predicted site-specific integrase-resolvase
MTKLCNTQQAASAVGISTMTLQRWLAVGKVRGPKLRIRDGHAIRPWSKADLNRLRRLKQEIYCKGRGRKKGYKRK